LDKEKPMNRTRTALLSMLVLPAGLASAPAAEGISPEAAFEKLKGLAGRWEGHVTTPDGPEGAIVYKVTAAGTLVTEVQFPDTDHEMVSLYYLDGGELRAKHFCSMGNQPEMKLDAKTSSENDLHFAFTGGTNMDASKDAHIHGAKISMRGDALESEWAVYTGGKEQGATRFFLSRVKD
jgi:hypothetical protein